LRGLLGGLFGGQWKLEELLLAAPDVSRKSG